MGADNRRLRSAHVADVALSATVRCGGVMAALSKLTRHARACRGHPRLAFLVKNKDVDGRDKPGHDVESRSQHDIDTMHPLLVTALVTAATWDAWRWYVQRVWESPEEAASLAVTVAVLGTLGV